MIRKHKTDQIPLTPALASEFSNMKRFVGERDLQSARLDELKQKLEDGLFFDPCWATATCNGITYRMNGQHSSKMLSECNGHFPQGLDAIIQRFSCDTQEDMSLLFEQFDRRKGVRSGQDVIGAHARIHPELDDVSKTKLSIIVSGLAYAFSGLNSAGRYTTAEAARLLHTNKRFAAWAERYAGCRYMCRMGIFAAIFTTWNRNPEGAELFWDAVRDQTGETPAHPTRVLAKFLMESVGDGMIGFKKWDQKAYYVKSIHAWNAWRENTTTQLKYHPQAAPPSPK
jgi:hypothetical protein